jgi:hypothetical protein
MSTKNPMECERVIGEMKRALAGLPPLSPTAAFNAAKERWDRDVSECAAALLDEGHPPEEAMAIARIRVSKERATAARERDRREKEAGDGHSRV